VEPGSANAPRARYLLQREPERFLATGDYEPPPGNLDLVFGPQAVAEMGVGTEVIAKKAALYGTHSIFVTPYKATMFFFETGEEVTFAQPDTVYSFSDEFADFLDRIMPFFQDGCIYTYPTWEAVGAGTYPYTVNYRGILKVELKKRYLVEQLKESPKAVSLFLPHIAGIPAAQLINIRHEYQDSLAEFHRALYGLVFSSAEDGDRALYEVMQEVDHNIRQLNDRMNRLRKQQWFDRMKLGLVGFPMILALAVPPEVQNIVQAAAAMVGSASAVSYIDNLRVTSEDRQDIERSPFYVPWLLQRPERFAGTVVPQATAPNEVTWWRRWARKLGR
jgi:hypothetical protein